MAKVQFSKERQEECVKNFPVLEPGNYECTVSTRPKLVTASTGAKMFEIELETIHPESGETTKIFDNLVMTEKSEFKIIQFLRSCGYTQEEIDEGIDMDDCYELSCTVKTTQEIYEGEPKHKVKRYLYESDAKHEESQNGDQSTF
jgi:hypothetical protein